jgi:hypothetical protein
MFNLESLCGDDYIIYVSLFIVNLHIYIFLFSKDAK